MPSALRVAIGLSGAAISCMAVTLVRPISDPDYWWHLRAGRDLVATLRLPIDDRQSLTADLDDEPDGPAGLVWRFPPLSRASYRKFILEGEWLSELVLFAACRAAGHAGTTIFAIACTLLALGLSGRFAYQAGAPPPLCLLGACASLWLAHGWMVPRPLLSSYIMAPLFCIMFEALRRGRKRAVVAMGFLAMLWSNLHGGYLVGILIALAYGAGALIDALRGQPGHLRRVALAWVTIGAGFALNPNGLRALPASLVVSRALFTKVIMEWQPSAIRESGLLFLLLPLVIAGPVVAAATRRCPVAHALLAMTFATMAVMGRRHLPLFSFIGLPACLAPLALNVRTWFGTWRREERGAPRLPLTLLPYAAAFFLTLSMAVTTAPHRFGIDRAAVPVDATAHINRLAVPGPIFNEYHHGGYLLWALDPPRPIFIDGRSLSERAVWEHLLLMRANRPVYPHVLDRYGIHILELQIVYAGRPSELLLQVSSEPRWVPTFVGNNDVVFVDRQVLPPSAEPPQDLHEEIWRDGLRQIAGGTGSDASWSMGVFFSKLGNYAAARNAFEAYFAAGGRAATDDTLMAARLPGERRRVAMLLAEAAQRSGDTEAAILEYRSAFPDRQALAAAGRLLLERARRSGADEAEAWQTLRGAAQAGACDDRIHELIATLPGDPLPSESDTAALGRLLPAGQYQAALKLADRALQAKPDDAALCFYRGTALLRLCRNQEAAAAFRRSADLAGGIGRAPASVVANLGYAYLDGGEPAQAFATFQRLCERDRSDVQAWYGSALAAKFEGRRDTSVELFMMTLKFAKPDSQWSALVHQNLYELTDPRWFRGLR